MASWPERGYRVESECFGTSSAILGLALLMIVHEAGHLIAARAFGMRVIRSASALVRRCGGIRPRGSETVYQVALIPFLAYVQIAGMNPLEEVDPNDKGSYANAVVDRPHHRDLRGSARQLPVRVRVLFRRLHDRRRSMPDHHHRADAGGRRPSRADEGRRHDRQHRRQADQRLGPDALGDRRQSRQAARDRRFERDSKTVELKVVPEPKGERGDGRSA